MAHDHEHQHSRRHEHGHSHAHHDHAPASFGRAFAIGIALNLAYVVAETGFGITAGSLALVSDAAHKLGDVLALGAAWGAAILATRQPSGRYTYGLRRTSVLAALGNAITLLVVTGGIAWEAIQRLVTPEPAGGLTIIIVAGIGIAVDAATALLFMSGRKGDLNVRAAFLHMAADALVAVGVVVAGVLILATGWLWLDPVASIIIAVVIVIGTWSLLREAVNLSLDAVPQGIEREQVRAYLESLPGVIEVHDLHIWGMSTTDTALTAHLICEPGVSHDELLPAITREVRSRFRIGHATVQLETEELARQCELRPDHVI